MIDNQITNWGCGQKLRLPWIDWAKAVGIYLVVLGHIHFLWGLVYIYMFHMAFFFMLSGFLYKRNKLRVELVKSFKSLIIPYFCFNFILLMIAYLVGDFQVSMIKNILLCNYEMFPVRFFSPLWFLVSLFIMRVFCSVIPEKYYGYAMALFFILSTILFYTNCFPLDKEPDCFQLATTCICLPSFIFGWILKKYNVFKRVDVIKPVIRYPILFLLLFAVVFIGRFNGRVNVFTCAVGNDILIYYVVSSVISLVVMYLFSKLLNKENRVVKTISTGTILIIGLHVAMIDGLSYGLPKNSKAAIVYSIIIMVVCYALIVVSLKYFPFIVGRNKKKI